MDGSERQAYCVERGRSFELNSLFWRGCINSWFWAQGKAAREDEDSSLALCLCRISRESTALLLLYLNLEAHWAYYKWQPELWGACTYHWLKKKGQVRVPDGLSLCDSQQGWLQRGAIEGERRHLKNQSDIFAALPAVQRPWIDLSPKLDRQNGGGKCDSW